MEEQKKVIISVVAFVAVVVLGVAIYYFFLSGRQEKAGESQGISPPKPEQISGVQKDDQLSGLIGIGLDESDDLVRRLASQLSSHPLLGDWLKTDDLIRKFVASVDNIANGQSPRSHVTFFGLKEKFPVLKREGEFYADPEGFERYDVVADVFSSLESKALASLYFQFKPVIQEAYRELGYPDKDFTSTLQRAIREVLAVPVVEGDIVLEKKLSSYALADPELERLSQAQKHLLRMGPANINKIQDKLREMAEALENPASKPGQ